MQTALLLARGNSDIPKNYLFTDFPPLGIRTSPTTAARTASNREIGK